jgi:glucose-1-phosphate cytidylyltransferase
MQVVILCGGKGTRAYPHTQEIPKALMRIGDSSILEQVMRIYTSHGYKDFILSCGYLKEAILEHFERPRGDWRVQCVDTGEESDTGERIWRLRQMLEPTFFATYCDGLADIDLDALLEFHQSHGGTATVTAVPLRSQYGILHLDGNSRVTGFEEKPILRNYLINGGFFVFNRQVFENWQGKNLEQEVLPHLAEKGLLYMYRHDGFWRSMDTYKDQQELNGLWAPYAEGLGSLKVGSGELS